MLDATFDAEPETDMLAYTPTTFDSSKLSHETNDCAVRAYMTVTGCTYIEAHDMLRTRCGRRDRKGTLNVPLMSMLDSDPRFERVLTSSRVRDYRGKLQRPGAVSLSTWARRHSVGTYYVLKPSHAFAVVDGSVVDTWEPGARCKVIAAWRFIGDGKAPVVAPVPARRPARPLPAPQRAPVAAKATVTPSGKARLPTALSADLEAAGRFAPDLSSVVVSTIIVDVVGLDVFDAMSPRQVAWATRFIKRGFKAA